MDLRHLKDNISGRNRSIELVRMLYLILIPMLMMPQPDVLNIRLSIIKDRHPACPKVNYIVHSTSILYGIRTIISFIMHLHNLSKQTETATQFSAVSILYKKLFKIHTVLVRTEFARIHGRNSFVRNIYRGGQGNYESPFQDRDILSFYFYFCNSTLGHPRCTQLH